MSTKRRLLSLALAAAFVAAMSSSTWGAGPANPGDTLLAPPKKPGAKKKTDGKPKTDEVSKEKSEKNLKHPALNFTVKDIDNRETELKQYYGNVILIVNTASKCGFTGQYAGMEEIYQLYKDKNFVVLAFPANNFDNQEPLANKEIKEFCQSKFSCSFPLFGKVSVKGSDIVDLYKYLTRTEEDYQFGGEIPWNFNKFLISRKGEVVGRFKHTDTPKSKKVIEAIEKELAEPLPSDSPLNSPLTAKPSTKATKAP